MPAPLLFLYPLLTCLFVFVGLIWLTLICFERKKTRRSLRTPEQFELLPQPGQHLHAKMEEQFAQLMQLLVVGALGAGFVLFAPLAMIRSMPTTDPWWHLLVGGILFFSVCLLIVRRCVTLLDERSNYRLGYLGERRVAEHLQPLGERGYLIYHDVPMPLGGGENLDHVVVGPHGVAVIETKTRSKPADHTAMVEVKFDGTRLSWPKFDNDTRTLEQIRRCAAKMRRFLQQSCGIDVPVHQVIAIPGWRVDEKVCISPRVVTGRCVADAVLERGKHAGEILSKSQIRKIADEIERLCRRAA